VRSNRKTCILPIDGQASKRFLSLFPMRSLKERNILKIDGQVVWISYEIYCHESDKL
jgi:hypothetical protein